MNFSHGQIGRSVKTAVVADSLIPSSKKIIFDSIKIRNVGGAYVSAIEHLRVSVVIVSFG